MCTRRSIVLINLYTRNVTRNGGKFAKSGKIPFHKMFRQFLVACKSQININGRSKGDFSDGPSKLAAMHDFTLSTRGVATITK
jgi:hypothetical protein